MTIHHSKSFSDQTMGTTGINEDVTGSESTLLMDVLLKASLAKARTSLSHDNARLAVVLSHAAHAPLYAGRLNEVCLDLLFHLYESCFPCVVDYHHHLPYMCVAGSGIAHGSIETPT